MSVPEGPIKIERQGIAVDIHEHAGVLLPDPPIGQFPRDQIMTADTEKLREYIAQLGCTPEQLIKDNPRAASSRSKRDLTKSSHHAWSTDDKLRLALLYINGYSGTEMADDFDAVRPENKVTVTEELIRVMKHDVLTQFASDLADENRLTRKWHALLHPVTPRSEGELRELEALSKLSRHQIFHNPTAIKEFRERVKEKRGGSRLMLPDADIAIRLLYLRYCEGVEVKSLNSYAKNLSGKEIKLYNFFGAILTEEAKEAFKMRRPKERWTAELYRYIASVLVMKDGVRVVDIGRAINKTQPAIAAAMRNEGNRLKENKSEYKNDSWFEAFLLEYAEPELFPAGKNPREIVRALRADRLEKGNARDFDDREAEAA